MTDSGYMIGEAAILALVQAATGFTAGNATRGNWLVLNSGKSAKYAILKPGAHGERVAESPGTVMEQWATVIQVWHRYGDDGTTLTNLEADVDALLIKIDQNPRLGDATGYVLDSDALKVGECQEMW